MKQKNAATIKSVVVVEDDSLLRSLMVEAIRDLGFEVSEFSNADDALIHIIKASGVTDLVVADLTVPGQLDGMELAEMLGDRYPSIPFILTTGYIDVGRSLCARVNFLAKPWSIVELSGLVLSVMSKLSPA